ncbi:MAG: signal peptidase II [Eubacterium sp.]
MNKKWISWAKIALFTAFFLFVDQLTKYLAVFHLKGKTDVTLINNVLSLHYLDGGNTGAAWGIFSGKIIIFIIFTIIAIVLISFFISNIQRLLWENYSLNSTPLRILNYSLALLLAGAAGNLIDRIIHGYVIDFIYFKLINFPIFNVADCYVTVSCFIIIIICMFKIDEKDFNRIFSFKRKNSNS